MIDDILFLPGLLGSFRATTLLTLCQILVIPGGFAPDRLRRYPECLSLVSEAYNNGAVIGFICHAYVVPSAACDFECGLVYCLMFWPCPAFVRLVVDCSPEVGCP